MRDAESQPLQSAVLLSILIGDNCGLIPSCEKQRDSGYSRHGVPKGGVLPNCRIKTPPGCQRWDRGDTDRFLLPRQPLLRSFYSHTHFPPALTPYLTPGSKISVPLFNNFAISRMLRKSGGTTRNLSGLTFFMMPNSLKIHPGGAHQCSSLLMAGRCQVWGCHSW